MKRRRLALVVVLNIGLLVAQCVVGLVSHSLALLSDAGHVATDTLGVGMALAATQAALTSRPHDTRTFGLYRLEILAALANAVLLFAVATYVVVEAVRRLGGGPEVAGAPVLVMGVIGLAVNLVAFAALRRGADDDMNMRGAYLEVVADAVGSVGVIVAAMLLVWFGWNWADAAIGAGIGLFILPRAWGLGRDAVRVLVQAAPTGVDVATVRADLAAIPGVVDVHDLHVWTLTSAMDVASAHVMVRAGVDAHGVLDAARTMLHERHGLDHATLQVEPDDHTGCADVSW